MAKVHEGRKASRQRVVCVSLHKLIDITIGGHLLKDIPHQDILLHLQIHVREHVRSDVKEGEHHCVIASAHTARAIGHTSRFLVKKTLFDSSHSCKVA